MAKKYVGISSLGTFLENLKSKFAAISHTHKLNEITDYVVDETLSSTSTNPVQNKVLDAEFEVVSQSFQALETAIDTHDHNDTYYTKTEIDDIELITTNDIDTICGASIQFANARGVTF